MRERGAERKQYFPLAEINSLAIFFLFVFVLIGKYRLLCGKRAYNMRVTSVIRWLGRVERSGAGSLCCYHLIVEFNESVRQKTEMFPVQRCWRSAQ